MPCCLQPQGIQFNYRKEKRKSNTILVHLIAQLQQQFVYEKDSCLKKTLKTFNEQKIFFLNSKKTLETPVNRL